MKTYTPLFWLSVAMISLSGCSSKTLDKPKLIKTETLEQVDTSQEEKFSARLGVGNPDLGGWLDPYEEGLLFKPAKRKHPNSAIVYFYRPDSSWSRQEIVGASIFINGKRLKGLKNNHYYWVELPEGSYRLAVRRPLPPLYLLKGTVVDFHVKAGQDYFLKYAEQYHVEKPNESLGLLFARPIMQMPNQKALEEIASTRLKTPGITLVGNPNALADLSLPPISGAPYKNVDASRLSDYKENKIGVEFKIYNPLTW